MAQFSNAMRQVAVDLMKQLGNPCVLTKVTYGDYDPLTGTTSESKIEIPTFSAPIKKVSVLFSQNGEGTNLNAFDSDRVSIPWVGQPVDTTWLFNGFNITAIEPISAQGDIIIYNISVGEQ
jgi:hypothetical protein